MNRNLGKATMINDWNLCIIIVERAYLAARTRRQVHLVASVIVVFISMTMMR